jgi:5-methylcytosine-specific restriction endonuclease McrA
MNALHRAYVMNGSPRVRGMPKVSPHAAADKLLAAACCTYCAQPNDDTVVFVLDHVVPLALGGPHTLENLMPACEVCNRAKKDMHPDDYRTWLAGVRSRIFPIQP